MRYDFMRLNPEPYGGFPFYERTGRAISVGTPAAYARTWVVGWGAGRGQATMLGSPPGLVKAVLGLPIYYAEPFGYYVDDYPGEFDTLAEAEAYARSLAGAGAPSGSPLGLVLLVGLAFLGVT